MALKGRIGLAGGGNMGSALLKGLLKAGSAQASQVVVAEKDPARAQTLAQSLGVSVVGEVASMGPLDLVVIAVKPPDVPAAALALTPSLGPQSLVISLAAGVTLERLAAALPPGQPLVRAMPNTPALVGAGVTALAPSPQTAADYLDQARQVFSAVGQVVTVAERLMDAVTGLSACGPAYVFVIIEALADAGVRQGLDRATSLTLAAATVEGSARLVLESGQHPGQLKDMVTSPGGATIAGLQIMERAGLRGTLIDTVEAATRRSAELGK